MGNYSRKHGESDESRTTERAYVGPTCNATNSQGQRCGQPAYQNIRGKPMCDGHAESERMRLEDVAGIQAASREWCVSRGLDTPERVRSEAARLARTAFFGGASKQWATLIAERDAEGEKLPFYITSLAYRAVP